MKNYKLLLAILTAFCLCYSCGKGGNPAPPNNNNNGNGGKPKDTTYTNAPTQIINTSGETMVYDVNKQQILSTITTNGEGGGVQTINGGTVSVELMNLNDGDFSVVNAGDQIVATINKTADPVVEYIVKDTTNRTITKYDVHINKVAGSTGSFGLVGTTLTSFKNDATVWNAANLMAASKSKTQLIQNLAVK